MGTLDLAVSTLFQEFQEIVLKRAALEKALRDEGTITRKNVKGKEYWYRQHYVKGSAVQEYIGPSTPDSEKKIASLRDVQKSRKGQVRQLIGQERRRISLLRRAGLPVQDPLTSSLLDRLSQEGLIHKNGVLVGSHAFMAYSGILGRTFEKDSLKTLDIDIVRDLRVIPKDGPIVNLVEANGLIAIRGKNFYSVPGLSKRALPSSFVGPGGLRIDFLTPLRGRPCGSIPLPDIPRVAAQALHFLDYLIEEPIETVLLGTRAGIAVTVPDPSRYAIHKLIVADRRPVSETAKRHKDIQQASELLQACFEERPDELHQAYKEARGRGKGWREAISRSIRLLPADVATRSLGKI